MTPQRAQTPSYRGIQCAFRRAHHPAESCPRASVLTTRSKQSLRIDHIAARVWIIVAIEPSSSLIHLIGMHPSPLIHVLPPLAEWTWICAKSVNQGSSKSTRGASNTRAGRTSQRLPSFLFMQRSPYELVHVPRCIFSIYASHRSPYELIHVSCSILHAGLW